MTKMEEINTIGGESVLLHLDDWEHCKELRRSHWKTKFYLGFAKK